MAEILELITVVYERNEAKISRAPGSPLTVPVFSDQYNVKFLDGFVFKLEMVRITSVRIAVYVFTGITPAEMPGTTEPCGTSQSHLPLCLMG